MKPVRCPKCRRLGEPRATTFEKNTTRTERAYHHTSGRMTGWTEYAVRHVYRWTQHNCGNCNRAGVLVVDHVGSQPICATCRDRRAA